MYLFFQSDRTSDDRNCDEQAARTEHTHHCHILKTANDSFRFKNSSARKSPKASRRHRNSPNRGCGPTTTNGLIWASTASHPHRNGKGPREFYCKAPLKTGRLPKNLRHARRLRFCPHDRRLVISTSRPHAAATARFCRNVCLWPSFHRTPRLPAWQSTWEARQDSG